MQSFYFIVTTMTTVGYGDMSGNTTTEQMFCIGLMIFGVFFFSMITGSLSSILATLDQGNAELERRVMFLSQLKNKHGLQENICEEI
jgi:voltage-gated potassium channel